MVNTRTSKASAATEGQKKPTSRPKTLTRASVVKGEAFKPKKSATAQPPTAKSPVVTSSATPMAVDPPTVMQTTVQEPILEPESTQEVVADASVAPEASIKSPAKGITTVNPKGTFSKASPVKSSIPVDNSEPSSSCVAVNEVVNKNVIESVVGDQVVVGGESISVSDLVARIQAELMAKLVGQQAAQTVIPSVKETEKGVEQEKGVEVSEKPSEKESDVVKIPEAEEEQSLPGLVQETIEPVSVPEIQEGVDTMQEAEEEELPGQEENDAVSEDVEKTVASEAATIPVEEVQIEELKETIPENRTSEPVTETSSEESSDEEAADEKQEEKVPSSESAEESDPSTVPSASSTDSDDMSPIVDLKKSV